MKIVLFAIAMARHARPARPDGSYLLVQTIYPAAINASATVLALTQKTVNTVQITLAAISQENVNATQIGTAQDVASTPLNNIHMPGSVTRNVPVAARAQPIRTALDVYMTLIWTNMELVCVTVGTEASLVTWHSARIVMIVALMAALQIPTMIA
jgi:hypothetical protein